MPWFKIDDSFTFHPKVIGLSPEAGWLWTRAGAWCAQQLTDGHVPSRILNALGESGETADELVQAGLWDTVDGGWEFHDWATYQPSREQVEADRAAARERQRRARKAAQEKRDKQGSDGSSHAVTSPEVTAESQRESRSPRPDPTRPVVPNGTTPFSSASADADPRPDVEEILDHLDGCIRATDPEAKLPARTKKNRDAARLLLDRDGRTVANVKAAIDFATGDEFWRPNIRSMSKLRDKYDQLRAQAARGNLRAVKPPSIEERRAAGEFWL